MEADQISGQQQSNEQITDGMYIVEEISQSILNSGTIGLGA